MPSRVKEAEVPEDANMEDVPTSAQPKNEEIQETGDGMDEDHVEEEGGAEEEEEDVVQRVRIVQNPKTTIVGRVPS